MINLPSQLAIGKRNQGRQRHPVLRVAENYLGMCNIRSVKGRVQERHFSVYENRTFQRRMEIFKTRALDLMTRVAELKRNWAGHIARMDMQADIMETERRQWGTPSTCPH